MGSVFQAVCSLKDTSFGPHYVELQVGPATLPDHHSPFPSPSLHPQPLNACSRSGHLPSASRSRPLRPHWRPIKFQGLNRQLDISRAHLPLLLQQTIILPRTQIWPLNTPPARSLHQTLWSTASTLRRMASQSLPSTIFLFTPMSNRLS